MKQLGLTIHNPIKAYQGYTLFAPLDGADAYLLDMQGAVVHRWHLPYRPGDYGYLLENGNLLVGGRTGRSPVTFGGRSGAVFELDWDGNILWQYVEDTLHHDFSRMENGNTMVLGWETVPLEMVPRITGGVPGSQRPEGIWSDYFREVDPEGRTVWEWHAYQHLDVEKHLLCPLHTRDEWTHCNTCNVLPGGNILTSFRLLDTVGIIDKPTGDFIWDWGRGELGHQHDPTQLDNGNILMFDNGWHTLTSPMAGSRILEIDPKTNHIEWQYKTLPPWDFFSSFISGAQRLPNGNTFICEGQTGRLFEVTMEGEIVWEYQNPFYGYDERFGIASRVFRAYRYGPDFSGFVGKDLSPGKHIWLSHLYAG